MGIKIQDVKEQIQEDVIAYMDVLKQEVVPSVFTNEFAETLNDDICDIVVNNFKKLED